MKKFSKFTSLMSLILTLSVLLCFFAGCDLVMDPPEDGTVAADIGNPSERSSEKSSETNVSGETKLQKEYCTATLDDDFFDDYILIYLFPEYKDVEYTVEDFADIDCICVNPWISDNDPIKKLELTLGKHSKENVLESIKKLEEREDVYRAEPDYCAYLD